MPLPKKLEASALSSENRLVAHRYVVERRVGSGSFGTVFLVSDTKAGNDKKVLKQIFVGELLPDDTVDACREAKLLSKLSHPSIVHFNDSFLDGDCFCIITEFCEGGDLDNKIRSWKESHLVFEESLVLDWFIQLTDAIRYIHDRRILHRDIKTRNIFLKNNYIKLGDFGISKILMGTSDLATTVTGTPYYMSPEVLKHDGYNSKSDIWSLGAVLYELCTLQRAFQGQSLVGVMYKIIEEDPPPLPNSFHPVLRDLVSKMLTKDPKLRPSATELLLNDYIKTHMEDLSRKMSSMKSASLATSMSSDLSSTDAHKAIAKALTPTKWKHLSSGSHDSQPSDPLTPKQLIALKKQEKADREGELRKKQAAENFKERKKREFDRKKKEANKVVPPWVKEHPDVFQSNFSLTEDSLAAPLAQTKEKEEVVSMEGSKVQVEMETSGVESMSIPQQHRQIWIDSGDIPEDPLLAETHYSQFEDFEDDVMVSESEDEYDAFIECIEDALHINEKEPSPEPVEDDWDDVPISAFGPQARGMKIKALRSECENVFGKESFQRAYQYLKEARERGGHEVEEKIVLGLKEIVANSRDCFLIDQLIFLEKQQM